VRVEPESAERPVIKVDQVRDLAGELVLSGQHSHRRVAIIDPADRLNLQAANSLLKTLEEPAAGVVLLLVAGRPGRLPATIRSRCQSLSLPVPTHEDGQAWLESRGYDDAVAVLGMANGAPLRAIALAEESVAQQSDELATDLVALCRGQGSAPSLATKWQATGAGRVAALTAHFMADILRAKAAGPSATRAAASESLIRLVAPLDWRVLYAYNDELVALRRALEQPLNDTLALERLFLGWRRALSGANKTG
jgi:DNA polymerase-3 subunit delta'